ncbi:hypothetical protein M3Y99_00793000 [Aphelenchoides fujianensis]|nr:hypothetical protein M3Y99_00793000 [Aphelenchoides fujianensis]
MVVLVDKLRSLLVRLRDQSSVTYSRFGRPGEEQDDRPLPTSIHVAPFDENDARFMFFRYWHVQKAAVAVACFGMAIVILTFISGFFEFNWYDHSRGVDISALLFLFVYLAVGVLIHYYVLYAVKKQNAFYLIPFICVYVLISTLEFIITLSLVFKMLENEHSAHHQPYFGILFGLVISLTVQMLMLSAIVRLRQYLSMKQLHEMELKVAERSRTENPNLEIVITSPTSGGGIGNPNESPRDFEATRTSP